MVHLLPCNRCVTHTRRGPGPCPAGPPSSRQRRRNHPRTPTPVSTAEPGDAAGRALVQLVDELEVVVAELTRARTRALELQEQRREGRSWYDIVSGEDRPLIVEQISNAMASL